MSLALGGKIPPKSAILLLLYLKIKLAVDLFYCNLLMKTDECSHVSVCFLSYVQGICILSTATCNTLNRALFLLFPMSPTQTLILRTLTIV